MLQIVLLAGKFVFLIILYLFIYRVVRSSMQEFRMSAQATSTGAAARPLDSRGIDFGAPRSGVAQLAGGGEIPPTATWRLTVLKSRNLRPGEAFSFPPGSSALVGRAQEMDIFLNDTFVSSKHAVFEATAGVLQVEDLRSTNGTFVNGTAISSTRELQPGDRVEIGDTIFEVEVR